VSAPPVAVVTGATGDVGRATAHAFAVEGYRVVVGYRRDATAAADLASSLPGTGHDPVHVDVTDAASLAALRRYVEAEVGAVHVLVNNAGVTRYIPHDDLDGLDDALFDRIFATNVRGAFATTRALLPALRRDGPGLVVHVSSIAARTGQGSNVAYCASKAALDSMTRSLARALAPDVRVVSVAPGLIDGPYADALDPAFVDAHRRATPLGRLATSADVASAILAVARDLTFSTGDVLPVDGGRPLV